LDHLLQATAIEETWMLLLPMFHLCMGET